MTRRNEIGNRYNKLNVIDYHGRAKDGHAAWLCLCDCGNWSIVLGGNLRSGCTTSCGCSEGNYKHGGRYTRIYSTWAQMKQRSNNPNCADYKWYGGKGIQVCASWDTFEEFSVWAKSSGYTDELTIDRIDSDGNYCPENCQWVTLSENARRARKHDFN